MRRRIAFSLSALLLTFHAIAQQPDRPAGPTYELDLNQFASAETGSHKKIKLERGGMTLRGFDSGSIHSWDSSYVLTRFPTPTKKRFQINALESRIDAFDTSQLRLCFVVVQLHNGDTVFREFPVVPDPGIKGSKRWTRLRTADANIVLQAAPFYLGYVYRAKPGVRALEYHSYVASAGGEGGWLSIRLGGWRLSRSPYYQILPYRISYTELE